MWGTLILINSVLLSLCSLFLVYAIGAAILLSQWKQLLLVFMLCIFLIIAQIALAAMAEP